MTNDEPCPAYVWKIKKNSLKKVKTLGKYILGLAVVKNKVYYASYPSYPKSGLKKMVVYRCNLNGSHRKKLFTLKGKGQCYQVVILDVNKKKITAIVDGGEDVGEYTYTIKTGKLKKN